MRRKNVCNSGTSTNDDDTGFTGHKRATEKRRIGETVVLPSGTYEGAFFVKPGVKVRGDDTTLKLPDDTDETLLKVSDGSSVRDLRLDGGDQPTRYARDTRDGAMKPVYRKPVLNAACDDCRVSNVSGKGGGYDGVSVRGRNVRLLDVRWYGSTRFGVSVANSTDVVVSGGRVTRSGEGWRLAKRRGGGAGYSAGGSKDVLFIGVQTAQTNGDGIAAYDSFNEDIEVRDGVFRNPGNHGMHLGGENARAAGNRVTGARLNCYYLANNWRKGWERYRNERGGVLTRNKANGCGKSAYRVDDYRGGRIAENVARDAKSNGVDLRSSRGFRITTNDIARVRMHGIRKCGPGVRVRGNTVKSYGGEKVATILKCGA